ncbi:MAG: hypothetical protein EPO54_14885 [Brevundimonas sp.]|nr:MAG: hypothetical protein EPO54_14885 [Brevundimonas sp.]
MTQTFLFDVKLFASVRVPAHSPEEAERLLRDHLDCASCNAGVWPDGTPITFEASPDGSFDLLDEDEELD